MLAAGCGKDQGRFKSFPIQKDEHLLAVLRYVERNALRAGLAKGAEDWRWGSLWVWQQGPDELGRLLIAWPPEIPGDWVERVNRARVEERVRSVAACGEAFFSVRFAVLGGPNGEEAQLAMDVTSAWPAEGQADHKQRFASVRRAKVSFSSG